MEKTTLYIKLEKNVEIATEDIFLKDLGTLFCHFQFPLSQNQGCK